MRNFEQVHVGMKQLKWPNGKGGGGGGGGGHKSNFGRKAMLAVLFPTLLYFQSECCCMMQTKRHKNRVHINFVSLPIELKSHPLTCKRIQHLALAVHQVTPSATKLEPTVCSAQQSTVCRLRASICLPGYN